MHAPRADWAEADSPFVPVADLIVPQQDITSEQGRRVEQHLERVSFDPWHAPEAFRPLGAMMRARAKAYKHSAIERKSAPEPDGTETW